MHYVNDSAMPSMMGTLKIPNQRSIELKMTQTNPQHNVIIKERS